MFATRSPFEQLRTNTSPPRFFLFGFFMDEVTRVQFLRMAGQSIGQNALETHKESSTSMISQDNE